MPRPVLAPMFRVASWNVNSVRARLGHIGLFVRKYRPDVLCLQEIRAPREAFPSAYLEGLGYGHAALSVDRGKPGVAILSTVPMARLETVVWCGKQDHRHLAVNIPGKLELHNFYVPAGGDVPDPAVNPKFAHKMQFLKEMAERFGARTGRGSAVMLVGDLNVAPLENDVWSHQRLRRTITHTEAEVAALLRVYRALDWHDVMREAVPPEQKLFTWWSYRARNWKQLNRGRRLDHAWVTSALRASCRGVTVASETRGWKRPSDHVPVVVDLDI